MKILLLFAMLLISSQALADIAGIWKVQGNHPRYGAYLGEVEIRPTAQANTFNVIRIANYLTLSFEGLTIQEVWTGTGVLQNQNLEVTYKLKAADYLNESFGMKRNPDDFLKPVSVRGSMNTKSGLSRLSDSQGLGFDESFSFSRSLGAQPLWTNQRQNWPATGTHTPHGFKTVFKILFGKILDWYLEQPIVKSYAHRKEFQDKVHYFVFDPTDFEFYQKNKNTVRVINAVIDDISLTEAISRRNAYSPTLAEKAKHFDQLMQVRHINEFGIFAKAIVDSGGNLVDYGADGDGALWTGTYVASQAMRFKAVKDPVALENVKKSTRGLFLLMDVTSDPAEFARYVMKYDPNQQGGEWRRGLGAHADKMWLFGGNNDMFRGITTGLMWAALVVPRSDSRFWSELDQYSARMLKLKILQEKEHNRPLAFGVRALITRNPRDIDDFLDSTSDFKSGITDFLNIDSGFYYEGIADWSGINLGMMSATSSIALSEEILKTTPDLTTDQRTKLQNFMDGRREVLMDQWKSYSSTRRDYLTIAAYAFAVKAGYNPPLPEMWKHNINSALWGLREIPMYRSRYDVQYDFSLKPDWCLSPLPRLPWKSFKQKQSVEYHMQGIYQYPMFESFGYGSNYIWKDGMLLFKGASYSSQLEPGTDYLLAYWMARMSGLAKPEPEDSGLKPLPKKPQRLNLPPQDPRPTPTPAKPVRVLVGTEKGSKLVASEKQFEVSDSGRVQQVIVSGNSSEEVEITEAYIEFAEGEKFRARELEYKMREGESRVQPTFNRAIRKITIHAKSVKTTGGRGEYKVEIDTVK